MGYLIVRMRILPSSTEDDLEELANCIREDLKGLAEMVNYYTEPIAFGLSALMVDFKIEEKEGGTEPLEERLKSIDKVSEVDVIAVSRASTKL